MRLEFGENSPKTLQELRREYVDCPAGYVKIPEKITPAVTD